MNKLINFKNWYFKKTCHVITPLTCPTGQWEKTWTCNEREKHIKEILYIEIISESYKQLDTSSFEREKEMGNILEKHRRLNKLGPWLLAGFPGGVVVKNLPTNEKDARDAGSIPGWGRSPGGKNGNPLWYSCLGNSMDRGAWKATV